MREMPRSLEKERRRAGEQETNTATKSEQVIGVRLVEKVTTLREQQSTSKKERRYGGDSERERAMSRKK
jgi:hypothetical protein